LILNAATTSIKLPHAHRLTPVKWLHRYFTNYPKLKPQSLLGRGQTRKSQKISL